MKLKNRETGEIIDIRSAKIYCERSDGTIYEWAICGNSIESCLEKIAEEWEDYEEAKEFYAIENSHGQIVKHSTTSYCEHYQQIGNYFETKEEAEKAVEKLKAWKRLRDKGLELELVSIGVRKYLEPTAEDTGSFERAKDMVKDFEFIFGGEE